MSESTDRYLLRPPAWVAAAAFVVLVAGCVVVAGGPQQPTATTPPGTQAPAPAAPSPAPSSDEPAQPDAPSAEPNKVDNPDEFNRIGEAALYRVCATACHGDEPIFSTRRQAREWNQLIGDMIGRGAIVNNQEEELIREYLPWVWGLVAVNRAPANELADVIGLSEEDAAAIVAYREANGAFENIEALLKVPDVDTEIIEWQSGALLFN